jgi:hypothetical protein
MKQLIGEALDKAHLKGVAQSAVDVVRMGAGAVQYLRTDTTPERAYQSMLRLFCNTGGYSNDILAWTLKHLRRPYELPSSNGVLGNLGSSDLALFTRDLDEKGYHVFEQKLPDEICDKLLDFSLKREANVRALTLNEANQGKRTPAYYDRKNPLGVRYEYTSESLMNDETVQGLLADHSLIAVAQSYLRSQPVLDIITMWWHTTFSKEPNSEAAQFFHFDMDRLRWLKFFFYLTDVGPENGPHTFVSGSHRINGIPKPLLKKGYARLSDDEVAAHYSKEDFIEFVGPRGTIIAEDTRGLHKGRHVEKGDRLVFQLQFSNSLFGGSHEKGSIRTVKHPELQAMIERYPGIYTKCMNKT